MEWKDEMHKMLAAFDRQATISLGKIKTTFKRNGFSLNSEFKQYFLSVSSDRINLTYDQFEMNSNLEDRVNIGADDGSPIMSSFLTKCPGMTDPVEVIDSSDEDDQIKTEGALDIKCDNNDETSEWNDLVQHTDSSYTEMLETESPGFNYQNDHSESEGGNGANKETMMADMNDGIPMIEFNENRNVNTTSKHSIIMANKGNADGAKTIRDASKNRNNKISKNKRTTKYPRNGGGKALRNQLVPKKRFKCQLCEYSSNYRADLNKHTRIHTGEKPYRCGSCGREFTKMQSLKVHKATHINEFPFHCRICFSGFYQKDEKYAHEKVCKVRRFECHICKKFVTVDQADLIKHMPVHSGERPFQCKICMKRFTRKYHMKAHFNRH
ncbi:zinc finger protein 62-like [Contarinia nasturtii]|uniref:zinc finger protein 62-like n=1 Tax=Contarinia nasturtii TaxID=265458 RepID=UPI0012D38FCE|nr:zinc finger protein 62-like [Contarinia nasturtii]